MRAVAYTRVSTSDQVDGFSLSAQTRAIRAYCEAQGWQLVGEYADEGVSASRESAASRPAFRQLLSDVDDGGIDVIVVHKLDRFSRNLTVTVQSLARIHAAGASFVSLGEHIDYTTPQGRLMLALFAAFAAFYSDNLATEVSKGRAERAQQGLWNGDLPFGYRSNGDPRKAPELVGEEARLVLKAYETYASGTVSAHEVAGWLNDQGARPRSKRGITRFTKATVIDMLSNPFYAGKVQYKGEVLNGQHAGIVSQDLFDFVTSVRTNRRKLSTAVKVRPQRVYLLRGLARCAFCNQLLWCHPGGKSGDRYRDAAKLKQRPCDAKMTSVRAEDVDRQVAQLLRRMVLPPDWREEWERHMATDPSSDDAVAQRSRLRARLLRLREVYLDGDMRRAEYELERARLNAELSALDATVQITPVDEAAMFLNGLGALWDKASAAQRSEMVRSVFQEVWVNLDTAELEFVRPRPQFKKLFDILWEQRVVSGDPERPRVDQSQLYSPMMELVSTGAVYRPGELAVA